MKRNKRLKFRYLEILIAVFVCNLQGVNLLACQENEDKATARSIAEKETGNITVDRWPGFLGAGRSKIDSQSIPINWSMTENIAWKTKLQGSGQSSPVIWGDSVFVSSIDGAMKEKCLVTALSLRDGKVRWRYQTPSSRSVRSNYYQSRSAPTPVCDSDGVYAFFETGKVIALDHQGKLRWARSLPDDFGDFEVRIGLAASPVQLKNKLMILVDHQGPSYLLALDKQTGKTIWKADRFARQSYSSPVILPVSGKPQIICSSDGSVDGYDPETGKRLWTFEDVGGNRASSPMPIEDGTFLIGASGGMHGEYSVDAKKSNLALKVSKIESEFKPEVLWRNKKSMPSFASPFAYKGLAYWVTNVGILDCVDSATGKRVYRKRLGQRCWATPIGVGNRIYFFGKDGTTFVVASGREFEILAENQLLKGATKKGKEDVFIREKRTHESASLNRSPNGRTGMKNKFANSIQYGFGISGNSILIRTGNTVYCVRRPDLSRKLPMTGGLK